MIDGLNLRIAREILKKAKVGTKLTDYYKARYMMSYKTFVRCAKKLEEYGFIKLESRGLGQGRGKASIITYVK